MNDLFYVIPIYGSPAPIYVCPEHSRFNSYAVDKSLHKSTNIRKLHNALLAIVCYTFLPS